MRQLYASFLGMRRIGERYAENGKRGEDAVVEELEVLHFALHPQLRLVDHELCSESFGRDGNHDKGVVVQQDANALVGRIDADESLVLHVGVVSKFNFVSGIYSSHNLESLLSRATTDSLWKS